MNCDINSLRNAVLSGQRLLAKSTASVEDIVSDLCGIQYDPYPAIHLNQYMMLWNRMKNFRPEDLDEAAYKDFRVTETWTFRRNMFIIPRDEYAIYKHATKGIVRWGESDDEWLKIGDTPEIRAAESELKENLREFDGLTAREIWERLNLSGEWDKYRRQHDQNFNLPIFRAYYRLIRKGDLITYGRNPGTFKEPVYILREKTGIPDWTESPMDENEVRKIVVEKLIASFAVTNPVHISHITGYKTADVAPVFSCLESEGKISPLPNKIGRKQYYIHTQNPDVPEAEPTEIRLISPMDALVRDKTWLTALFDYSFSFEYFKKKGMKWPLSVLSGNRFVGYLDCKMDWKTGKFIVKERNVFDSAFDHAKALDRAIEDLAAFHNAKEIVETT